MIYEPRSAENAYVYVFEAPVRIWHWVMVLCIVGLAVTGYLIGSPLPTTNGEASQHFVMGYIRFAHFACGYVFVVGFVARILWAFFGNSYSREIFLVPFAMLRADFWAGLFDLVRYYLFLGHARRSYNGHNPLAGTAMGFMFALGSTFMILSGLALYGEGTGMGSWQYTFFSSWLIPLVGGSQAMHTWHHLCMWYILLFAIVHMYMVVREDIFLRVTVISTMINGWRVPKP